MWHWTGHPWRWIAIAVLAVGAAVVLAFRQPRTGPDGPLGAATEWNSYGADAGGSRHSGLRQINRENVGRLQPVWTYRTGDASHDDGGQGPTTGCGRCHTGASKFETTPILADGRLYLSTPLNRVIALDPATGRELWRHDPRIDLELERNEGFISRGVSYWRSGMGGECGSRIFFGTIDARLLALDAATGRPCREFGDSGTVRLDRGIGPLQVGQYGVTSPPAVARGVVVVGSSIGDNRRVEMEWGTVRGYDALTGRELWRFDPVPRDLVNWDSRGAGDCIRVPATAPQFRDPGIPESRNLPCDWTHAAAARTGGGNAWAPLSADTALGLVFVPTGSAAPDFYGGERPGDNRYTNSVVALDARSGQVRWHFQVVHHDLWDFDVASQPALITVPRDGRDLPAVAVATKMGLVFILDRLTGKPLFPVEERPVPASDVPGEVASPTQPFPLLPAPLFPDSLRRDDIWGLTPTERDACLAQFDRMRHGPLFTPPSLEGTVMYPGFGGGTNWGGVSWSPERHLLITNMLRIPMWVRLEPRGPGDSSGNQVGTPYRMSRGMLASPRGVPCSRPPWGNLVAIDLASGRLSWQVPLGRVPELSWIPWSRRWGAGNLGGSVVTAGDLVFIGAAQDDYLRAFDLETGEELWRGKLPAGGQATPMTYAAEGRQYVVIAAGGNGNLGTTFGDYVVAFALR